MHSSPQSEMTSSQVFMWMLKTFKSSFMLLIGCLNLLCQPNCFELQLSKGFSAPQPQPIELHVLGTTFQKKIFP